MFGELSVIQVVIVLVVALLVFGPARLPELGRQLGKGLRDLKQHASGLGADLQRAVDDPPDPAPAHRSAAEAPQIDPDDDRLLLAGVVVTTDAMAPGGAPTDDLAPAEDDLLQGVVISGDTPPADVAQGARTTS